MQGQNSAPNGHAGPSTLPATAQSFKSSPLATNMVSHSSVTPPPSLSMSSYSDAIPLDVIPTRAGRKLCVRHKQMASQNVNERLQKSLDALPLAERSAVTHLWSTFSNAQHAKRKLILEGILTMCCFSQLSHLSDSLNQIIRIDPFSLLPREVNLRILGYLDAITLGRAAQVSKSWKALADDDLLWRRMCGQHIDRKCEKCGWGLPLLERRRLKVELNEGSPAVAMGIGAHDHGHGHDHWPQEVATREEALGAPGGINSVIGSDLASDLPSASTSSVPKASAKRLAPDSSLDLSPAKKVKIDGYGSDSEMEEVQVINGDGKDERLNRAKRLTRPWKSVYCERLVVERNWRKGRCKTLTLKGHTDGVMCLQYHTTLNSPSYPILITGSYDRTVRVWNLNTGEAVRTLRGHTRAIRALQFDQMLLFTGAMDGTVRMWNWRAGECLRVLEGHTDGVVSLSYNGYLLASGSADKTIQVWNFRTGTKFTLRGHDDWVNAVLLWDGKSSPGDMDPTSLPSFPITGKSTKGSAPSKCKNKPQPDLDPGALLFSGSDDGTVKLWDLNTQQCIRTFSGHKGQVQSVKVMMVNMSEEEVEDARRLSERHSATPPPATSAFQPASTLSPSTTASPSATLADLAPTGFDAAAHAATREEVLEPKIFVHDAEASDTARSATPGSVKAKAKEEKRPMLVTGALDGTIKLWDVETGMEQKTCFGWVHLPCFTAGADVRHIEGVWGVDIDALRIASASHDRTVKIWDRETGKCVHTFTGHRGAVTSLQLSDDMIVSGSDDGDVMVWNFAPNAGPTTPAVPVVAANGESR